MCWSRVINAMRKVIEINSNHTVSREEEYHELSADCKNGQVLIQLPYANDFKEIKISKRDAGENNCVIKTRGLDKFSSSDEFLTLDSLGDWILLRSDGNETWEIASFSRSVLDETFDSKEEIENFVEMIPPPLPVSKEEKDVAEGSNKKAVYYAVGALATLGGIAAWALS